MTQLHTAPEIPSDGRRASAILEASDAGGVDGGGEDEKRRRRREERGAEGVTGGGGRDSWEIMRENLNRAE